MGGVVLGGVVLGGVRGEEPRPLPRLPEARSCLSSIEPWCPGRRVCP